MNVVNCKTCGRLFNRISDERVCPQCKQKLEEKFQNVKEYLNENPRCPMEELAQENDVTVKQIKQWVREERLVFSEDSPVGIECENCGQMIRSGKYCATCKSKLANNLQKAYAVDPPKTREDGVRRDGSRMRFL